MQITIDQTWDGSPVSASEQVFIQLTRGPKHLRMECDAPFYGDPAPSGPAGPYWKLWEHEVVELFVLGPEETYTEIEVGPHGHHLVLQLAGRRQVLARELPLELTIKHTQQRWTAVAELPLVFLPPTPWRGNAYAIHGLGAKRRFLAGWPVPGPHPDFHRLEHFRPLLL